MQKVCRQCQAAFEVTEKDQAFYDKISPTFGGEKFQIPSPTLCPDCRYQRRIVWRSEYHVFKRESNLSGKPIISFYPPEADCVVYSSDEWWSDDWDPMEYGRDFDFNRSFFDQFNDFVKTVPLMGLAQMENENSMYVNNAGWNKNCYLVVAANNNEDCYYGNYVNSSKNCLDNSFVDVCELCYECIDCKDCYKLNYSYNCHQCSNSYFLESCKNCKNCFGSINLRNKEYVFLNKQLSKEEYEKKIKGLKLHLHSQIEKMKQYFAQHRLKYPHRYYVGEMNENITGSGINTSRNSFNCYNASDLEDCKNCSWFHSSKDCMDCYAFGFQSEKIYEVMEVGSNAYQVLFCVTCVGCRDVYYSFDCVNCSNLFGCISLRNKEYCIFNKQYSKEEYEKLVPQIIKHMMKYKEFGEFFPMSLCPLAYNQTIAQDYIPLSKEEVQKIGGKWNEEKEGEAPDVPYVISDSILEEDISICDKVLTCKTSQKPYKIIPQEYKFYKEQAIPIPRLSPFERHLQRLQKRLPPKLYDRKCMKCNKQIQTPFEPNREEQVYCEECYLQEVY